MSSAIGPSTPTKSGQHMDPTPIEDSLSDDGSIDFADILARIKRGLISTIGLTALGFAFAALFSLFLTPLRSTTTTTRVAFSFDGYSKSEYPDHSKFEPDDLRAPDVISQALKNSGTSLPEAFQNSIRPAITIEGLIPPNVIKERDRLRATGQAIPQYLPDEFLISLTLPRTFPLTDRQRELLLREIVVAYHEKFYRTYANVPLDFGDAFTSLKSADFYEYELVLVDEIQNITSYLNQQLEHAKTFRSQSTNHSFSDLLKETELFKQLHLFGTLGFIRQNGLSRDREFALVKMEYILGTLKDQQEKAQAEEKVVDDLLSKTEERSQNYVLGIKSQTTQQRPESPILDQGLIDSLLANDAYNFLVRQALTAGLKVKGIEAERARLLERKKDMETFLSRKATDQTALFSEVQESLGELEAAYNKLILDIRLTHADFSKQAFADAIRITMQPVTGSIYKQVVLASLIGGLIGLGIGIGLSLLRVYIGSRGT